MNTGRRLTISNHRPRPAVSKIVDQRDLLTVLRSERRDKVVVFTNGCFDIFHAGHVTLLEQARAMGDILVVGVNSDSSIARIKDPSRPIQKAEERMMVVASVEAVDFVVEFNEDKPLRLIEQLKPEVHVKGGDYKEDELPETPLVHSYGGEVRIIPHIRGLSSTRLIEAAAQAAKWKRTESPDETTEGERGKTPQAPA